MTVKTSLNATSPDNPIDKGGLFCVSCPDRSRYDETRTTVETDNSVHHRCPNCGTEIATRESGGALTIRTIRSPVAETGKR